MEHDAKPIALWDFAVALYGRPGAEAACLRLQDRGGLDIPVLLFCLWAGFCGPGALADEAVERARQKGGRWEREVTGSLRAARRALKQPGLGAESARLALREQVIAAERESERIALDLLADLTTAAPAGARGPGAASANVGLFIRALGLDGLAWVEGDLEILLAGATALC